MLAYAGKSTPRTERVDLAETVRDLAGMLEVSISKKASLRYEIVDGDAGVDADITQLRQVILNLVTNASDALEGRSGTVRLSVLRDPPGAGDAMEQGWIGGPPPREGVVSLRVEDTGVGMAPETVARMFDPFFSTKAVGRGLGLAAVLGIVKGHRGAIRVESHPGRGTCVEVALPLATGRDLPSEPDRPALEAWTGTGTALVADDDPLVLSLAGQMLSRLGFAVVTARDGQEVVEAFTRDPDAIRLVLLDLTMPGLDGIEALREIRRLRSDVPVLVASGYDDQNVRGRIEDAGPADFIHKPFGLEELRTKLASLCRI